MPGRVKLAGRAGIGAGLSTVAYVAHRCRMTNPSERNVAGYGFGTILPLVSIGPHRAARQITSAMCAGGVEWNIIAGAKSAVVFQGASPTPPQPPQQTPDAPVEEPPDAPLTEPSAPVREPAPEPEKRFVQTVFTPLSHL